MSLVTRHTPHASHPTHASHHISPLLPKQVDGSSRPYIPRQRPPSSTHTFFACDHTTLKSHVTLHTSYITLHMSHSSQDFPPDVDEMLLTKLTKIPSVLVASPTTSSVFLCLLHSCHFFRLFPVLLNFCRAPAGKGFKRIHAPAGCAATCG